LEREGKGRGREGKRKKEGRDGKEEWRKGKDGKGQGWALGMLNELRLIDV